MIAGRRTPHDYRPALDGVRAVAVLAVIAYHTGGGLPGGFLGVDVFFVLSGYLITGLLVQEHAEHGRIALHAFWTRRARRLLPAVLVLLVVCALVTAQTAPASTLAARRGDMFATLFYYANWHFISTSQSYFATFTGVSPLRHTWSLAIEEQFYLLWPIAVVGLLAFTRRVRSSWLPWLIIAVAVASAVRMATLYTAADPARSYYGTDTRVHQLLIGAALASFVWLRPTTLTGARPREIAKVVAVLSAIGIGSAFFLIGDQDPFYYRGGALLFAVVVAAGIWAFETLPRSAPARLLSLAPVAWIGRISYGLYLWHWPMIVWLDGSRGLRSWTSLERQALEVSATFVVATLSFYLLERPVRYGTMPWLRTYSKRFVASVAACVLIAAALVVESTAISSSSIAAQVSDTSDSDCPAGSPSVGGLYSFCSRTEPAHPGSLVVAVAGDSTSRALNPGMRKVATKRGWRYVQAGQNGCSLTPLLMVGSTDESELTVKRSCTKYMADLLAKVLDTYDPDVWIVTDWNASAKLVLPDGTVLAPDDRARIPTMVSAIRATLAHLTSKGGRVVYLASAPTADPVECATDKTAPQCNDPLHSVAFRPIALLDEIVRRATANLPGVVYVSVTDVLCPANGHCPAVVKGELARYDGVHFTSAFSRKIVPIIIARAKRAGISFSHRRDRSADGGQPSVQ